MTGSDPSMPVRLDHLVIAARDLDALAEFYRRLGFTVGARNRHPWGTENHIVQFDQHFLELIGLSEGFAIPADTDPAYPFAAFLAKYLRRRSGLAMFVRSTSSAETSHGAWHERGIGLGDVLNFERAGQAPDGTWKTVAFSLAFAASPTLPHAGFFACQNRFPENFWASDRQVHPNGVTGVKRTVLTSAEPATHVDFLDAFLSGGVPRTDLDGNGISFQLSNSVLSVERPQVAGSALMRAVEPGAFEMVVFRVKDLDHLRSELAKANIVARPWGTLLLVAASDAFGLTLAFEEDHDRAASNVVA